MHRAGPSYVVAGGGGGTESRSLEPSGESREGESMRGGLNPLSLCGSGGPPPEFILKSMYLRTHFKPF